MPQNLALIEAFPSPAGRVLVIDRGHTTARSINRMLNERGIGSVSAKTAEEGFALAGAEGADIIIVAGADRQDDEVDNLTRKLKAQPATALLPVIVVGGPIGAADSVLPLPFGTADLFARLDVFMRLNTMREELQRRVSTAQRYGIDLPAELSPRDSLDNVRVLAVGHSAETLHSAMTLGKDIEVVPARGRTQAMGRLLNEEFDGVVVTGFEDSEATSNFCRDLRLNSQLYHMPLLALFDTQRPYISAEDMSRGVNDYLDRPFGPAEVRARLLALVRQHRQRRALRRLYSDGHHALISDALTGLYSRGFLLEHLDRQVDHAKRFGRSLTVSVLAVANMEGLNRVHGYAGGDRVLRQVGGVMRRLIRVEDLAARYGGAAFCVVMPDTAPDFAFYALHRIASVVENTDFVAGEDQGPASLQLQIGAVGLTPVDSPESLVARARAAMA